MASNELVSLVPGNLPVKRNVILFLLSDNAAMIHGETLVMAGGCSVQ